MTTAPVGDISWTFWLEGVELTDARVAFLADARAILYRVEHAFAATKRIERGELGQLAIGFTASVPFHPFVPRVIRTYREAVPQVALTLEENGARRGCPWFERENADESLLIRVRCTERIV
jgi:DNA-binding transcriptional LysR family regulator